MQIFLDTANIEDIKKYASWGIIDGVTTNPTLIAKEGVSLEKRIKEIAEFVKGPISAEVIGEKAEEMIEEARKYSKWRPNVYIKIPMTNEGLKAVKTLNKENINTNMTLIFSLGQAILAAKAGTTILSPFVGRLDDIKEDGMSLIKDIVTAFKNYDFDTKVVVASIRNTQHVLKSALIGADICTVPTKILDELIHHPLTDEGIEKFLKDWEKVKSIQ